VGERDGQFLRRLVAGHLGAGPGVDDVHARSLRAALLTGQTVEITDPGESEDVGVDWADPRALTSFGDREATEPWSWHGPARSVTGGGWGGCLEVIEWILTAGRFPVDPGVLDGGVLILETSEELLPARNVGWIVRALGERGILAAVDAVLVARPPVSDFTRHPTTEERARLRAEQRDVVVALIGQYNPDAVICVGIPFGHTRPQWIVPHGGAITVDGTTRRVLADYSYHDRSAPTESDARDRAASKPRLLAVSASGPGPTKRGTPHGSAARWQDGRPDHDNQRWRCPSARAGPGSCQMSAVSGVPRSGDRMPGGRERRR
jgi:hypothetical protein